MRQIRILLIFITILCLTYTSTAQEQQDEELVSLDERGYGLYIPTTYEEDGTETLPLVIALHGFGDTWENFYPTTGLIPSAEENNFIVAFPQGHLNQWNDGSTGDHFQDDVQILLDLIERVDRDYRVDLDRIYLVGFSNGGTMVFRAACDQPGVFAGIAAISGTMRIELGETCPEEAALPVLIMHSVMDTVVSFAGGSERYPVPVGAAWWTLTNDCNSENVPFYDEALFQNDVAPYFFDDCANGDLVLLYAIQSLPHVFPGAPSYVEGEIPQSRYDSATIIWTFFDLAYQAQQEALRNPEVTPEATETTDE